MVGKKLKIIRKRYNLTQKSVADGLGIARSTYSSYENDKREPDYKMLIKLADFFNVSVDYLLDRTGKTEDKKRAKGVHDNKALENIIDTLYCASNDLSEKDYKYLAEQIDQFIKYARGKRS